MLAAAAMCTLTLFMIHFLAAVFRFAEVSGCPSNTFSNSKRLVGFSYMSCSFLFCSFTDLHPKHQTRFGCSEFVGAMSDTLLEQESENVKKSPFFRIVVDESTCVSTDEHLLVYVVFMKAFSVVVRAMLQVTCYGRPRKVVQAYISSIWLCIVLIDVTEDLLFALCKQLGSESPLLQHLYIDFKLAVSEIFSFFRFALSPSWRSPAPRL